MPHWGKNSNSQTAKRIWNPWPPDSNSLHHARHCHMAAPQKPGSGASKHIIHSPELSLESFCYSKTLYIGYCFPVKLQLSEERSQQKATGTEDWISVTIPSFTSGFPREMCGSQDCFALWSVLSRWNPDLASHQFILLYQPHGLWDVTFDIFSTLMCGSRSRDLKLSDMGHNTASAFVWPKHPFTWIHRLTILMYISCIYQGPNTVH